MQAQHERAWEIVEQVRARNADISPEDVLAEVTVEVEAVRQRPDLQPGATAPSPRSFSARLVHARDIAAVEGRAR